MLLYFVKRLYNTLNVDFKSKLTISVKKRFNYIKVKEKQIQKNILPSGRAFGFGSPTSSINSNANATLCTLCSNSCGVK